MLNTSCAFVLKPLGFKTLDILSSDRNIHLLFEYVSVWFGSGDVQVFEISLVPVTSSLVLFM